MSIYDMDTLQSIFIYKYIYSPHLLAKSFSEFFTANSQVCFFLFSFEEGSLKAAVTHHSRDAGDELDAVLQLLLRDLHRCAVLLLQREGVRAALRHPGMELQPQGRS